MSLRKAGYSVTTSNSVDDALELVELTEPDMVVSDTQLDGKDGFEFIEALKAKPKLCKIPFVFLSTDGAVESKVRGLELGADEYLTKPVYIREILTRINLIFQRQEQEGALRTSKTRFAGSLADMGLVDLLQTIDVSRKSGVLHLNSGRRRGAIYFSDGKLVDAELGDIIGEPAVYRFLVWNEGEFEVDFREVRREERITISTQGLLMEGMRRLDEWGRLQEQLPAMSTVFQVNHDELLQRLAEIPDEINEVFRLFDGKRTLADVVDASVDDDLATMNAITKLYFEGFIVLGEPVDSEEHGQDYDGDVLVGAAPEAEGEDSDEVHADALLEPRETHPGRDEAPTEGPSEQTQDGAREDAGTDATAGGSQPPAAGAEADDPRDERSAAPPEAPPEADEQGESSMLRRTQSLVPSAPAPAPAESTQGAAAASGTEGDASGTGRTTDRGFAPVPSGGERASNSITDEDSSDHTEDPATRTAGDDEERSPVTPPEVSNHPASEAEDDDSAESNVIRFPSSSVRGAESAPSGGGPSASGSAAVALADPEQAALPSADPSEAVSEPRDGAEGQSSEAADARGADGESTKPAEKVPQDAVAQAPAADADAHADEADPGPTFEDPLGPLPEPHDPRELSRSSSTDLDAVETFFSTPAPAPHFHDSFADLSAPEDRQAHARRRAQGLAISITVGAFLLLGALLFYYRASMSDPLPEGPVRVALPTPDLMVGLEGSDEPTAGDEPNPTPVVEAPPAAVDQGAEAADQGAQAADPTPEKPAEPEVEAPKAAAEPDTGAVDEAYAGLLEEARRLGFRRSAEKVYLRALALKPEGDEALSGLGMLLLNRGKNQQALERASHAVAQNPENSEGWIVLGAAHDALGHNLEARKAYQQCAKKGTGKYVLECKRMLR